MTDQLPALSADTKIAVARTPQVVPAPIADAGDQASCRFVEFFTANIRNANAPRLRPCMRKFSGMA